MVGEGDQELGVEEGEEEGGGGAEEGYLCGGFMARVFIR